MLASKVTQFCSRPHYETTVFEVPTHLSPGLNVAMLSKLDMDAMRFPWLSITPLGLPVEPDVYMMMAVSLGLRIEKTKNLCSF